MTSDAKLKPVFDEFSSYRGTHEEYTREIWEVAENLIETAKKGTSEIDLIAMNQRHWSETHLRDRDLIAAVNYLKDNPQP